MHTGLDRSDVLDVLEELIKKRTGLVGDAEDPHFVGLRGLRNVEDNKRHQT